MIFLMAVVFSAVTFGIWPAVYASVLSFLAYNFFFIEPLYTFTIAEPHELLALVDLPGRSPSSRSTHGGARARAGADRRSTACARRGGFMNSPAGSRALPRFDDIAEGGGRRDPRQPRAAGGRAARRDDGELELRAAWPPEDALDTAAMTAARWALEHDEPAGADTATLPAVPWLFLPLQTGARPFGVVGVGRDEDGAAARCGGAHSARYACRADGGGARPRLARTRDGGGAQRGRDRARAQYAAGLDLA